MNTLNSTAVRIKHRFWLVGEIFFLLILWVPALTSTFEINTKGFIHLRVGILEGPWEKIVAFFPRAQHFLLLGGSADFRSNLSQVLTKMTLNRPNNEQLPDS
jgi:hypothetical protein